MLGQALLDRMQLINRELKIKAGESGVTRGLEALNVAQDYFETLIGTTPRSLGGQIGTVTTTADTETTSFPTGLLRIDGDMHILDSTTSRPTGARVTRLDDVGDHAPSSLLGTLLSTATTGTGAPKEYWTDGTSIYWRPLPDATHTVRWYGFQRQGDITAASTFAYDDGVSIPMAIFAVELIRRGLDDPITDYLELADRVFQPTIRMLKRFRRERAPTRQYAFHHDT